MNFGRTNNASLLHGTSNLWVVQSFAPAARSLWLVRHGKRLFASTPLSALDISEQ
jgi:hypothetical protein